MSVLMKRRVSVLATMISVLLVAGVAFAAWSSNGEGDGQAVATTAIDSVITPSADGTSLFPGADHTFVVEIDNDNDYPVRVLTISAGTSDAVNGCAAGSVTSDAATPGSVIAANSTETFTLNSHMIDDPSDACQGQTFNLPLTATLESAAG